MIRSIALCMFVATVLSGCVTIRSREPLYDRSKESTFHPGFAGTWSNDKMRWRIEPGQPDGALVLVESLDPDDHWDSEACPADLVPIGSWRYMFLRPPEADPGVTAHALPWIRLKRKGNDLYVSALDPNELVRRLESGKAQVAYEWQERQVVMESNDGSRLYKGAVTINAPAKEIRRYLERREDDRTLFPAAQRLSRE